MKKKLNKEEQFKALEMVSKIQEEKGFITDIDLQNIAESIISNRNKKGKKS